jgi:hypothetical protein
MKKLPSIVTGVAAGLALALSAASYGHQPFAGTGPGFGPGMGMGPGYGQGMGHGFGPGMGMGRGYGPGAGFDHAGAADARLADVKARLNITAAQESAWQAFAAAAKEQGASMQALRDKMHQDAGTAPERMALHAQAMQQRAAGMAAMSNAFNALYEVLTPEQKAIADQNFGMGGPRGPRAARRAS